jgi:hypothetical protein
MEKENLSTGMEIYIKASGKMIYFMEKESTQFKMDIIMRDNGIKERNKGKATKFGRTDRLILGSLKMTKSMAEESFISKMVEVTTKASFLKTKFMEEVTFLDNLGKYLWVNSK